MEDPTRYEPDLDLKDTDTSEFFQVDQVQKIKGIVSKYFQIYDIRWNEKTIAFYFNLDKETLELKFEQLRTELKLINFLPKLMVERGEHVLYIVHRPKIKTRSIWINMFLIVLTLFTTTWAGAILWYNRTNISEVAFNLFEPLMSFECVIFGFLSFALPLMIILGTHETAHYLAAKKHNIDASLPFFIPLPPPFILGTMGAFISMREPISNKKALLDIGAAGPIAGFIVSIPILIIGFTLETLYPVTLSEITSDMFMFNEPLLFAGIRFFFPSSENTLMHPTAFAGWVGLFVTALNLIPGGQLDGGHIARALLGNKAKYLSMLVILVLILLSIFTAFYLWLFFALIIILLGSSHPPPLNDVSPLGIRRQAVGAFCIVMLVLCIHYSPITQVSIEDYDIDFVCDNPDQVVDINGSVEYYIDVYNNADESGSIEFSLSINTSEKQGWITEPRLYTSKGNVIQNWEKFNLKPKDFFTIYLKISPDPFLDYGSKIKHDLKVRISGMHSIREVYTINTHIGTFDISTPGPTRKVQIGNVARYNVSIQNIIDRDNQIIFAYNITNTKEYDSSQLIIELIPEQFALAPYELKHVMFSVSIPFYAKPGKMNILLLGRSTNNDQIFDSLNLTLEIIDN